ncbi:hypothetical protein [Pectinatus frisingensis]|uniref:hypothetical protein n=1 Tax=Pectinatus frisingensis TaxID=865 RepID=UPI0018C4F388|nr:hypothetical protein [Pectinatus frisingensis]
MENSDAKAEVLWKKFYMVTTEMYRFIKKNDTDMFLSLLDQRLELQKQLEQLNNKTYHKTEAGKALIRQINPLNVRIRALAQSWLISHRNLNNKVHSYDTAMSLSGNFFNKKL